MSESISRAPIPLAPWRSPLSRALHRNRALVYARYAQLATLRPNGRPANRTIVFRGFVDQAIPVAYNDLKFITDRRSEKVTQIDHNNWGELCWYFPKTREQFRLAGELAVVDATNPDTEWQKLRHMTWHNLSDAARAQFGWPDPKQVRADQSAFAGGELDPNHPLDHFCLLRLMPTEVDHLELKGEPQNRCLYTFVQGQWQQRSVNP